MRFHCSMPLPGALEYWVLDKKTSSLKLSVVTSKYPEHRWRWLDSAVRRQCTWSEHSTAYSSSWLSVRRFQSWFWSFLLPTRYTRTWVTGLLCAEGLPVTLPRLRTSAAVKSLKPNPFRCSFAIILTLLPTFLPTYPVLHNIHNNLLLHKIEKLFHL